jgi:aspartate aminotransferase
MPLREAICAWHKRELGSNYQAKECAVSVGGKHGIFNVMSVLVQAGDEVIVPAPYWVSFPDIVKYAGGTPVYVETRAEDGFSVKAAAIEKAFTPKTKLLILNSPSNPTGGVVPPDEYERILAVCKKHNVWLMGDECYSHFTYEPNKPYSIASAADSKPNVVIIGSVSKTFAMTGWRIGYALAPESLVQALIKLQSQSTSNPTSIAQYAALEAMRGSMETVPVMLAEYARRRKKIVEGLNAIPGVRCQMPGGAFYAFPNVAAHLANGSSGQALAKDTTELAKVLLDKARVALVAGDAFGAPGYLRLSYATSIERIEEGLRRLERFFTRAEAAA